MSVSCKPGPDSTALFGGEVVDMLKVPGSAEPYRTSLSDGADTDKVCAVLDCSVGEQSSEVEVRMVFTVGLNSLGRHKLLLDIRFGRDILVGQR